MCHHYCSCYSNDRFRQNQKLDQILQELKEIKDSMQILQMEKSAGGGVTHNS